VALSFCDDEDDLLDGPVHDFLEAVHVRARLLRTEVEEAAQLRVEELLGRIGPDPDDLVNTGESP
jgi:hypothetical protein